MSNEKEFEENGEHTFTCPDCGSHDVNCQYEVITTQHFEGTLACTCEEPKNDGIAAIEKYHIVITDEITESGQFDENGRWEKEDQLDTHEIEREEVKDEYHEYCPDCVEAASEGDWETEQVPPDELDTKYGEESQLCANCGKEVE